MKKLLYIFLPILILAIVSMTSCKKDQFTSSGKLNFSRDTVVFDTIFTQIGTATFQFKIYNKNNQKINISEIRLMGGASSPFRMNIDGDNSIYQEDIEVLAEDSLFGFVEVTLNTNGSALPMVVRDSIQFVTNGTPQYVQLVTWGQDVYVHNEEVIGADETWPNDKPHLVYNYVAVDEGFQLTIQEGTNIHFHNDAQMLIYKSRLEVIGQQNNKVTFQGDRLESFYDDVAGQWYGIRFVEPVESSTIDWAIIKNGSVGVQIDSTSNTGSGFDVNLRHTEIKNQSFYGIWANAGAKVSGESVLVNACTQHSVFLFAGGEYDFKQCTFGGYDALGRQTPLFRLQNYFLGSGNTIFSRPITANFVNCAIHGTLESEFSLDTIQNSFADVLDFNTCSFKNLEEHNTFNFIDCNWNENPNFISNTNLRFTQSSCLEVGNSGASGVAQDLDGQFWPNGVAIGCFGL